MEETYKIYHDATDAAWTVYRNALAESETVRDNAIAEARTFLSPLFLGEALEMEANKVRSHDYSEARRYWDRICTNGDDIRFLKAMETDYDMIE